ncbi:MAG TPA: C4-type zinc ribbon domain-containing protein [Bacteroidota bacterium]|nr:C4-type zinc ribbon domain-containing protein [Bacteroidota bacterium]
METKLRQLFALQQIDSSLDELEELKGDLPAQIRELEAQESSLNEQISALDSTMKTAFIQRDNADSEIIGLKQKAEKYKAQQFQVRNNKEYDALTREMDAAQNTIVRLEKEMEALEGKATNARNDIDVLKQTLDELQGVLAEKRSALAEVSKTTEAEEAQHRHEREKIVHRIARADLNQYERIRKAKKGKAVVPVRRGACGGCFNRVPPQKLLELRQNNKLYLCEHCGRIIVSDEIAETKSSAV